MRKTIINHDVILQTLKIKNKERNEFRMDLNNIPYLLYEVEDLEDGRKIVINKPGGKRNFGRLSPNDLMVFVFDPNCCELWLISHDEIFEDLKLKYETDKEKTVNLIYAMEDVCNGAEPEDVLRSLKIRKFYWYGK